MQGGIHVISKWTAATKRPKIAESTTPPDVRQSTFKLSCTFYSAYWEKRWVMIAKSMLLLFGATAIVWCVNWQAKKAFRMTCVVVDDFLEEFWNGIVPLFCLQKSEQDTGLEGAVAWEIWKLGNAHHVARGRRRVCRRKFYLSLHQELCVKCFLCRGRSAKLCLNVVSRKKSELKCGVGSLLVS